MSHIARPKIRIYYYIAGVVAMVFMAASMSVPYFLNMKKEQQTKIDQLAQSIISEKKRHLADIVNRTILEIDFMRQDVVNEYTRISLDYCSALSRLNIWNDSILFKKPEETNNFISFVVYDTRTFRIVFSSNDQDAALFSKDIDSSASNRESFPVLASENPDNRTTVSAFVSRDKVETIVKNRVKDIVRAVRLGDDGYIWINQILNYTGGDDYAIRLVHPNLPKTEGLHLSTKMEDAQGNLPYKTELEGVTAHGALYFDYYFKKMATDQISHKLTYAKLYKPYDWVIATGVYLDDVDSLVQSEQAIMNYTYNSQLRLLGIFVISIFAISIAVLIIFERQINTLINSYINVIQNREEALRSEKENVDKAFAQLENVAYLDYLTGIWNRRAMYARIIDEASRCTRNNARFVVIIGDIDHFKDINDTYGHPCGDLVLKHLSELLKQNIRKEDSISRWGGEEFLILGTGCDIAEGVALAEKLRSAVENMALELDCRVIRATMTFGVAGFGPGKSIDETIKEADALLYRGKQGTRNCVVALPPAACPYPV